MGNLFERLWHKKMLLIFKGTAAGYFYGEECVQGNFLIGLKNASLEKLFFSKIRTWECFSKSTIFAPQFSKGFDCFR